MKDSFTVTKLMRDINAMQNHVAQVRQGKNSRQTSCFMCNMETTTFSVVKKTGHKFTVTDYDRRDVGKPGT
ncbi:hypothetical protein T265_06360 [Opisthorchis viverrini]|uniref:Uncharacterized protein n=1 Tax=Opisthorchis viverrini TaxID=6198 RepID=A0A074ZGP0_OPIVI|nr:hypothetical protein T265_06360 [Opisthorchis viverrini]KER26378.1 hypothetical protein T265_06360 [Opisthorchis viverrini]